MNSIMSKKSGWLYFQGSAIELLLILLAFIYLINVYVAIIRIYLMHSFLVEVDCKETLAIFLI